MVSAKKFKRGPKPQVFHHAAVAQWLERHAHNVEVVGSSPIGGTPLFTHLLYDLSFLHLMPGIPSCDDLPFDLQERFLRLEEILRILRPQYDAALHKVRQAQQEAATAISAFLDKQGLSYTFEKSDSPFTIDPMSANVDGVHGQLIVQGVVEKKLAERIGVTVQQAGLDVIDRFAELKAVFAAYGPIAHDSVMKYSRIDVIGGENPKAHEAVVFVIGRSAYEVSARVDFDKGDVGLQSIAGDPQYILSDEARSQIFIDHAHCEHNTYLISHPSRYIDFDDLCRHVVDILIDRCFGYRAAIETKEAIDAAGVPVDLFGGISKRSGTN